jgi:hypothetical protein
MADLTDTEFQLVLYRIADHFRIRAGDVTQAHVALFFVQEQLRQRLN